MNNLKNIIKRAIDTHMHIGPEPIPRKYTAQELVREEKGKIAGFVLKNHFYQTSSFIKEVKNTKGIKLFGGIVLNNSVGGLNPKAICTASSLTNRPLMVWFPTIDAENFLLQSKYEIAPEWINNNNFQARKAKNVKPVMVTRNKRLTKETVIVLETIKKCNCVLATGHIGWQESMLLINKALSLGINKIVITHPIYQRINMSIAIQKILAKKGCFIEVPYSMYSIDKISIDKIVKQIKAIGSKYIIISSDMGQSFSLSPSQALFKFANLLKKRGITNKELNIMIVSNPRKLLNID
jgi:hypothetical protein